MQIKVDCYCGYRGEETPKYILMGTRKIEIIKILDRWLAPDHRYFKVDSLVKSNADGARRKCPWGAK